MSKKYPGWDEERLKETKEWLIATVLAFNNMVINTDIEPIDIRDED